VVTAHTKQVNDFFPEGLLQLITFIQQYDDFLLLTRLKSDELLEDFFLEMGEDISQMSRYGIESEPTETITTRRLQLVTFLEWYVLEVNT
jgi:hypothetical protein